MTSRILIMVGSLALCATSCLPGECGSSPAFTDDSTGSLLETESSVLAGSIADAGDFPDGLGPGFENEANPIDADMNPVAYPGDPQCIEIGGDVEIDLKCPQGTGLFQLTDLAATACDSSLTCTNLTGTLDVQEYSPMCSDETCGSLKATLTLPVVPDGGGPFVSGTANLAFIYSSSPNQCSLNITGGG